MKYGCIGERLSHSYSKEIHEAFADYEYEIVEIEKSKLGKFLTERDFLGINVTIPYKETVMPYLDEIHEDASLVGSVNTIVNNGGKLIGYNTDIVGMTELLKKANIRPKGKKAAILGTGGTSKTARAVLKRLGASEIVTVSRESKSDAISYEDFYLSHTDTEIIINTTPVGMYPRPYESPIDVSRFPALSGVADAVYNPLRTKLVSDASAQGIPSTTGLYMLVSQAVKASEIFLGKTYADGTTDEVFKKIEREKKSIVLIGMPSSGKSTVGKLLSDMLGRDFIDTDEQIVKSEGKSIPDIFKEYGEARFREIEAEVIERSSLHSGAVIATGGGCVLLSKNVEALKKFGKIYFIDRPLEHLVPTSDRPLSSSREDIEKRYRERYEIYLSSADERIDAKCDATRVANLILEDFCK